MSLQIDNTHPYPNIRKTRENRLYLAKLTRFLLLYIPYSGPSESGTNLGMYMCTLSHAFHLHDWLVILFSEH